MILCEAMRVEMFNYFWLDLKSWEVRKQYASTLVDRIPIKQSGAQSNCRHTCTYNYNLQCSRVKYKVCAKMFSDTFSVLSRTIDDWISTSTGDNSPTTTITLEAVLSPTTTITLEAVLSATTTITPEAVLSATTTITPEAVLIKAKPAKVSHNKVPKECKEFIESLATVESHQFIVQNIEIESLWNLEQLC